MWSAGLFPLHVSVLQDCAAINAKDKKKQFERKAIHVVIYHPSIFLIKTTTEEGGQRGATEAGKLECCCSS